MKNLFKRLANHLLKHVVPLSDTALLVLAIFLYALKCLGIIGATELYSAISLFVILDTRRMVKHYIHKDNDED